MKTIAITQNRKVKVDDELYDQLVVFNWHYHHRRNRKTGKVYGTVERKDGAKSLSIARQIMKDEIIEFALLNKIDSGQVQVDYINNNPLDCRKENLRCCTNSQNQMNRQHKQGFTRLKGGVFEVKIAVEKNKMKRMGKVRTELEARNLYNHFAQIYYGQFFKPVEVEKHIPFEEIKLLRPKFIRSRHGK
jgi:hypothetical protein